jgi:hypothetical protein
VVGLCGTDFEPGAFLTAFLLYDRVHAMRRAVAVSGQVRTESIFESKCAAVTGPMQARYYRRRRCAHPL